LTLIERKIQNLKLSKAFEADKIKSCLEKIYEFNIMKYGNAKMGAVNGMRPNGEIDITSLQSEEMWVGVTDSIAALMIYEVSVLYIGLINRCN
jgi:non-lysosomal glucosylceramidase